LPKDILKQYPVDLLVLGDLDSNRLRTWQDIVAKAELPPIFVIKFWEENMLFREDGPVTKTSVTHWDKLGYATSCRTVNSTQVGGVIDRYWLVVVRDKNIKHEDTVWK
jgi:hypothetical protein